MAAVGDNTRATQGTASDLGPAISVNSSLQDQLREVQTQPQRNLEMLISVPKPTNDAEAAKYADFFRSQPGNVTWGDVPKDLLENIQRRLPGVELKPGEPVSNVLGSLVGKSLGELGKQEGLKLVESLKEKLGPEATYALLGAAAAGAGAIIARENPGFVANFANTNIPGFTLLERSTDNFQGKIVLTPQLTEQLDGAYLKYGAEFKASTADMNYGKKPPAEGEMVSVGGGTLKIHIAEGGGMVAIGKDGKEFAIPATVPGDKDNTPLTSRTQVEAYLTTQLKSNLPMMSPEQEKGIATADLLPKVPARDDAPFVATATGKVDGSTRGDIAYSGAINVVRPMGPDTVGLNFGAGINGNQDGIQGYNASAGATIPAGTVNIPLSASYTHAATGDTTKLTAGVDVPNWRFSVGAELTMLNGRTSLALPASLGVGNDGALTVAPTLNENGLGVQAGFKMKF